MSRLRCRPCLQPFSMLPRTVFGHACCLLALLAHGGGGGSLKFPVM